MVPSRGIYQIATAPTYLALELGVEIHTGCRIKEIAIITARPPVYASTMGSLCLQHKSWRMWTWPRSTGPTLPHRHSNPSGAAGD